VDSRCLLARATGRIDSATTLCSASCVFECSWYPARLRDFVAYADQGLLHWAIARHEMNSVVLESKRWNHPCDPSGDWVRKGLTCNDSLLKSITTGHPNASIVHFYGVYKLPSLLMAELCNSLIAKKNCQP
jgi:hypothetical protein